MALEYIENIAQLLGNLIALLLCLFQYISSKTKGWAYATAVFLCSLMSCYYWTAYLMIMGDTPNVSNLFSYCGWNVAFVFLLILVLHMKSPEERRWFHPLMLLPVPLNLWQLSLYLPYGGVGNSVYQVAIMTAVSVYSLQSIFWYRKNRASGAKRPYVAAAALLYSTCEFGMWTSTCFDPPVSDLYYPFSFLCSISVLLMVLALSRTYRSQKRENAGDIIAKYQTSLKIVYFAVLAIGCIGGIMLGIWMRDTMATGLEQGVDSNIYDIIPVVLFIISLFLAAFAVAIIFVVNFSEKVAENNALREATRVAEHSNAAKSEFLANMSHEIRTPINAVLGMNEMILRESLQARDLPPVGSDDVGRVFSDICNYSWNIQSAGNNLLSIINDVLDFSKIEAGKLEITESGYKLSSVLNDVSNMIGIKARDKNLDFLLDIDSALPDALYGDEFRVRQIMTNILNNAVKYTWKGSVSLRVQACGEIPAEKGSRVCLEIAVKDTGIGIRQEDIGRLFQKFERVDLQKNSTVEGTGLGLAITQSLLDMMGGSIRVDSVYGEGSTFTVLLPQKVLSPEPVGDFQERFQKSMLKAKAYKESFRAPDARILAVDDTKMNLTVVVSLLKKTGIQIDTAISGPEAISLCDGKAYDLILMDQRMPDMDGTEAMCRIRAQSSGFNRDTPFICLTADAVSGARERYLAEGFTDYLTKPIDSQALEKMLIKYLPAGKVQQGEPEDAQGAKASDHSAFQALTAAKIDPEIGLGYCGNSTDMYEALLREYAQSAGKRAEAMNKACTAQDWKRYGVEVHALKSTSRMIGAAALSELAAELEHAADARNTELILRENDALIAAFTSAADRIRQTLNIEDAAAPAAEDEILEFLPDDT